MHQGSDAFALAYNESLSIQMILEHFKWKLNFPTASLFCEIWSKFSIWRSDLMMGSAIDEFELVQDTFDNYVNYFLAVSLQVMKENFFKLGPKLLFIDNRVHLPHVQQE